MAHGWIAAPRGGAYLAIVYVSEGRCPSKVRELATLASTAAARVRSPTAPPALVAHSFADPTYNRTSFFFVGSQVAASASAFVTSVLATLDFSRHRGTHPTLGTVDHVCFSPLGTATLDESAAEASSFASSLQCNEPTLPIYAYGPVLTGLRLRDIRKRLGYFSAKETCGAQTIAALMTTVREHPPTTAWRRVLAQQSSHDELCRQDVSPAKHGVLCVGSVPFVLNYNLRCRLQDPKVAVAKITSAVRCPEVEALTLQHRDGAYEVACNLLDSRSVPPETVLAIAAAAANDVGAAITDDYFTGPTETALLDAWRTHACGEDCPC
ncbi:hypothetical protein H310_10208 [Aphanomyces invadans]|uniref:Formiminotransferase N-terminal subdomain domain-containing protein n=1 Tax=Aphanomyces invadans TaxID=157072 RepID=A0A024TS71_9STRA|nr:hypothetical protein H310_10208 [Aphanomyces invadans]ETV96456.1 hypothetical protein H310_10208 [Aphanomyces invadans]|eukprot:XP_008874719.1 hypothetical protein H310_10208 [Aphanomyces invadans]